ncbi:mechanosensitive ion channel domain-containing protein, partial [Rahnella variigena]
VGLLPAVRAELAGIAIHFGKSQVTALTLIEGSLSATVVMLLALWLSSTLERRLLDRTIVDLSMRKVAANATRAGLLLVGLLFALSAVGVDLTALSVLGGAVGVGLGFGLQKLASNYVSGFVILLERSLRIGDNVRVDGFEGRITDIKT